MSQANLWPAAEKLIEEARQKMYANEARAARRLHWKHVSGVVGGALLVAVIVFVAVLSFVQAFLGG